MKKIRPPKNFFKKILNDMLIFVGALAPDGKILFANNTALEIIGTRLEDIEGKMLYDAFLFQHSDETRQIIKNAIEECRTGSPAQLEIEIQTAAGSSLMWIDYTMHPIRDEYGKVEYLVAEGRDITSRKEAEKAKLNVQVQYQELINSLPLAVFETNTKDIIVFTNQSAFKFFGYTLLT